LKGEHQVEQKEWIGVAVLDEADSIHYHADHQSRCVAAISVTR
jgi:hypothetical protein